MMSLHAPRNIPPNPPASIFDRSGDPWFGRWNNWIPMIIHWWILKKMVHIKGRVGTMTWVLFIKSMFCDTVCVCGKARWVNLPCVVCHLYIHPLVCDWNGGVAHLANYVHGSILTHIYVSNVIWGIFVSVCVCVFITGIRVCAPS